MRRSPWSFLDSPVLRGNDRHGVCRIGNAKCRGRHLEPFSRLPIWTDLGSKIRICQDAIDQDAYASRHSKSPDSPRKFVVQIRLNKKVRGSDPGTIIESLKNLSYGCGSFILLLHISPLQPTRTLVRGANCRTLPLLFRPGNLLHSIADGQFSNSGPGVGAS